MIRCWRRSPLVKPQRFHRCMRSLNAVCKCKMCTSAFSMDGQRWFRCRWWSVDSPLHPHRHRRRCLMRDRLHRPQWMSTWQHHHRLRPLQRQLLVVRHLHQCLWSSVRSLHVVDNPLASSMLHADASSSLAIAQIGWPHLPPPMEGPNGPRSDRHDGRFGGRGWGRGSTTARAVESAQRGADTRRGAVGRRQISKARGRAWRGGPGQRDGMAPSTRPPVAARRLRLATGASSPGGANRGQAGHGLEQMRAQRRAQRPRGPATARTRRAARLPPSAGGPAGQAERLGKARAAPCPGRGLNRATASTRRSARLPLSAGVARLGPGRGGRAPRRWLNPSARAAPWPGAWPRRRRPGGHWRRPKNFFLARANDRGLASGG
jgi:hypothetical protein